MIFIFCSRLCERWNNIFFIQLWLTHALHSLLLQYLCHVIRGMQSHKEVIHQQNRSPESKSSKRSLVQRPQKENIDANGSWWQEWHQWHTPNFWLLRHWHQKPNPHCSQEPKRHHDCVTNPFCGVGPINSWGNRRTQYESNAENELHYVGLCSHPSCTVAANQQGQCHKTEQEESGDWKKVSKNIKAREECNNCSGTKHHNRGIDGCPSSLIYLNGVAIKRVVSYIAQTQIRVFIMGYFFFFY